MSLPNKKMNIVFIRKHNLERKVKKLADRVHWLPCKLQKHSTEKFNNKIKRGMKNEYMQVLGNMQQIYFS